MSLWQLASRSLRHFWQTNLALLLGISICTAVLAGALIVGDSIRASLKSLTIQRLGRIDDLLLSDHFIRAELADELRSGSTVEDKYREVIPAILLNQTTIEVDGMSATSRMQGVTVIGCDASFWDLDTAGLRPRVIPSADQIVINESVALELGVVVGQRLLIRVGISDGIGADSPLANKDDLVQTIVDLEIVDVIPTKGLGRFSLQTSQQVPANAFVSLATLQDGLGQENKINAIFVAGRDADRPASAEAFVSLQAALRPTLEDLGLSLKRVQLTYQADDEQRVTVAQYDQVSSEQMLFAPEADAHVAADVQESEAQSVFTYLATRLDKLDAAGEPAGDVVPYSTISGVESVSEVGPLMSNGEPIHIADDGIVLNTWAAEDLQAAVGDRIRVTYFEPETTHGETVERSEAFQLQAIVPITKPSRPFARRRAAVYDQPPTLATDPDLTPEVPGITDNGPISQWEAPFPIDYDLLDPHNDEYGDYYRTMPKAFVSLSTSRRLWRSRFGETTSYRLPVVAGVTPEVVAQRLAAELGPHPDAFGLHWLRVKTDGLRASSGTTPFDALFLGFSMFIIASALVLVSLLLRFSLEQRAAQIGLLASLGFAWKRNLRALLLENSLIVVVGSMVGVALGVGYAWLMLMGLRTWWVAAVVTPFMELSVQPATLAIGGLLGVMASLITVVLTLRRLQKISAARLLSGKTDEDELTSLDVKQRGWLSYAPWALLIMAIGLDLIAPRLAPEPQAGAFFFGSGSCVLIAILLLISSRLRRAAVTSPHSLDLTLKSLAARNLTRNPARSTLTIGLVASTCFLIVAISAFRLAPTDEGTGGFQLVGQSDQPIFADLRDPAELKARFDNQYPQELNIFALRMQDGDDASCRNLYRTARPRLIGITETFRQNAAAVGKMEWAGVDKQLAAERGAWDVLAGDLPMEPDVIPVVLDKNTAMYSMQLYGGIGEEFERDYGPAGTLKFRVVGLLAGSIFQGSLLIPDAELLKHFPRVSGSRYFLVACPESDSDAVSDVLEEQFSTEGLDLTDTRRLLTELLAVQNTYLSTFQSLGGLGLLLGTFGLAAVQLRNVIQRRGELALLRATGYRNDQLSILLLWEHALLLFGGLAVGVVAAAVVVLPHLLFGGASIPVLSLAMTLGLVAIVGLASAVVAQRYLNNTPLLPALRGD